MAILNSFKLLNKKLREYLEREYPLFAYFYKYPRKLFYSYKNERLLKKGIHVKNSNYNSVILFTTHKSASSFITRTIKQLIVNSELIHINFESYFAEIRYKYNNLFKNPSFLNRVFSDSGYYYGAFRQYIDVPELENYKVILLLRDPRDVLTSHYYSARYSHPVINFTFYRSRKRALKQTIDEYAIENSSKYKETYSDYINKLLPLRNVKLLRYEDMIQNFEPWLREMICHMNVPYDEGVFRRIVNETSFKVGKEDKNSHKRNVKAGDHINKLKKSTINHLNELFGPELKVLGYKQ